MKIIFLDFDGVMNTVEYERYLYKNELPEVDKKGRAIFDPNCINNLHKIIEATGADIVVSSDWKYIDSYKDLLEIFNRRNRIGCELVLEKTEKGIEYYWHFEWIQGHYEPTFYNKTYNSYIEAIEDALKEFKNRILIDDDGEFFFENALSGYNTSFYDFVDEHKKYLDDNNKE